MKLKSTSPHNIADRMPKLASVFAVDHRNFTQSMEWGLIDIYPKIRTGHAVITPRIGNGNITTS